MNPDSLPNQRVEVPPTQQSFIDWMKAVGMFFIVFGHVVGSPNQFTQPIYPKQLGVAFFVFIVGWSLANDSRSWLRVLFNRLFRVYIYGIGFALFLSLLFIFIKDDANISNYLPFFLGINVVFNNFPANPTTWYIGTYLHLLFFGVIFLRGRKIRRRHIAIAFACEIVIRSLIMTWGKEYIAYMLLPNWLSVFLLGSYSAQKHDEYNPSRLMSLVPLWLAFFGVWALITNAIGFDSSFPFRKPIQDFAFSTLTRSTLISFVYCAHTMFFFAIARSLPRLRLSSFFARNTLFIFIAHMPVIYGFSPVIYGIFESTFIKKSMLIFILYFGLAIISEIINRNIDMKGLRDKTWTMLACKLKG